MRALGLFAFFFFFLLLDDVREGRDDRVKERPTAPAAAEQRRHGVARNDEVLALEDAHALVTEDARAPCAVVT